MKCVIPGGNVKILAKAIHTLAKIGDEMYVNPQEESISFRTVNMAKSAYSDFTFHRNFFSYYDLGNLDEEEAQKCKISMRSAMTVFKSAHTLDKHVETCHIHLEMDACNLVFILKYKNGINISHLMPILDSEKLQASYTKASMSNELTSRARTFTEALQNFPQNLIEITLQITPHKLLFRNYVDDASVMVNTTRTQLAFGIGEFDRYTIGNETSITFCVKEFKALLVFSESVGVPITASFGTAGRPILFMVKSPAFETNMLLSTLSPDCDSQSDTSIVSRQVQSVRKKNSSRSTSNRVNKMSSSRIKKLIKPTVSDVSKNTLVKEKIQSKTQDSSNKTLNENRNASVSIVNANANNSINDVQERNSHIPVQRCCSVTCSPASTSSAISRKISEGQRKLVNSVFSSITKRKSMDDKGNQKEEEDAIDCDLDDNVPQSPPRKVAKKAKVVFQKCFQNTFDPRMLPGHNTILVEDSDENNSD
ncbi:Cell cycle checkpoint control protein RAD9A [Trachymyrmex septentrionalis]|uniref:Cell cycle checkpoint control protein RAD9A n=1 Tax=Trachymyrmex septentrionalis TaxID=34720 RepID=A0A195FPU8_9HYME|nr:PREDICTED: cell cycle checkpoint control protein RAD9A [Trachymyrmex septentrionalis]KYN42615.1 Cell cycle checkpoint control protein RAD9A [Trachymyrmex septentrionalis]